MASLYDEDFYLWTQDQAARLRALGSDNRIDAAHLAEEVEDMGRAEVNKVASLLVQMLTHLVKLATADAATGSQRHWQEEIVAFQGDARRAFTPGMRQRLDMADLWADAVRRARAAGVTADLPSRCPFALADLLDQEFDVAAAAARLRRHLAPPRTDPSVSRTRG